MHPCGYLAMMIWQIIIALFSFSSINGLIYIYNTDDSQSVDFYDCIYHETMFYCRRPKESIRLQRNNQPWNCSNNGTRHSFKSLLLTDTNVSTILHEWKSGVDKAEEYSHYRAGLLNSTDGERYLCECDPSSGSFGQHCEYLLPIGETFAKTAVGKWNYNSITRKYGGDMVCYKTLECDSGLLCLDWRDICNGIQNCMFGYDEENCDRIEFNECEGDEYRCMNGMCIPDEYFLDGEYDCMDSSDEKQQFNDLKCPSQLASSDCDDRTCPPNQWSCGDGQCIKDRLSLLDSKSYSSPKCTNRRDQMHFCEANAAERLWTLPNGQCYSSGNYIGASAKNDTIDDYCTYLLRCSLSRGAEKNCPCGKNTDCTDLLRNICSSFIPIQYPKGALFMPYIHNYYNIEFIPKTSYEWLYKGNGTIKCRGYMVNLSPNMKIPITMGFEIIEVDYCIWGSKRTNSSNEGYHQSCHKDSRTFNNHSYHFIDVCTLSRTCISGYRIKDGIKNCKIVADDEETVLNTNSSSNVHRHRFRCSIDQPTYLYANSLGDGYLDCKNNADEYQKDTSIALSTIICNNRTEYDCKLLRHYIESSWDSNVDRNSTLEYSLSKTIPFRAYCDTFWDLSSKQDEDLASCQTFWICPEEKWQCHTGQCIHWKWKLDVEWDCPDASDEINIFGVNFNESHHNYRWMNNPSFRDTFERNYQQLPYADMCNSSTEYPCLPINMPHDPNDSRFCIDMKFIGDSKIDCMGGHDERSAMNHCDQSSVLGYHYKCLSSHTCIPYSLVCTPRHRCPNSSDDELWCKHYKNNSSLSEFTCHDGTVIIDKTCNNVKDCSNGEDEYMCDLKQSSGGIYRKQKQLDLRNELPTHKLPTFPVDVNALRPEIKEKASVDIGPLIPPIPPILTDASTIPDWCNRGIGVLTSNGSIICFCPPQYHGDQCQYHSDRISVYLHLNLSESDYTTSTDRRIVIKLLILFLNENQVLDTEEIHVRPVSAMNAYTKNKMYFHYSRSLQTLRMKQQRYANRSNILIEHPYSLRIEAYEMKPEERPKRFAVWEYPIYFDYLPVYRLAKILRLTKSRHCQNNPCNQNQECYEILNQNSQYICLCKANYSGPNCEDFHPMCQDHYCSPKALCQPLYRGLSNGQEYPYCVCPFDRTGQRCELLQSMCSQNPCQNGGTCYQRSRVGEFSCQCTVEYEGDHCETMKQSIFLSINPNHTIDCEGIVVQYFNIDSQTLELQLVNQSVHWPLPDSLLYLYEKTAPKIILLKTYINSTADAEIYLLSLLRNKANTSISEENHCHHVNHLFSDNSVFKYHHYCRTNQSLLCFRDDAYLCICEDGHQRVECFNYDYELDRCWKCRANGRCLKGDNDEYLCLCPSCHTGQLCQFNFESFSFTLDQLFFNDLLSENSLTQRITYSLLILIPSLFFLIGLINNLFCFDTFRRSICLHNGIGQYLLSSTIINQINLAFLLVRFVHLTMNISHNNSSPLLNGIMCKVSSYLLVSSTRIIYWLSSLIAIERMYVTLFFSGHWLKKPHIARRLVLMMIVSTLITTAHELAFIQSQISTDDGHHSMCVLNFPSDPPFWKTWHLVITVINASIPFLINLSCTAAIIYAVAKKKIKLNRPDTGTIRQHTSEISEVQTIPEKTPNKLRLLIDVFIENKEFIVAPAFTLIPQFFSLPFFIASFSLACQNLHGNHLRSLLIASYMATFIPQLTSFFLYISPSSFYSNEWHATKISKRLVSLKQRLRLSNR